MPSTRHVRGIHGFDPRQQLTPTLPTFCDMARWEVEWRWKGLQGVSGKFGVEVLVPARIESLRPATSVQISKHTASASGSSVIENAGYASRRTSTVIHRGAIEARMTGKRPPFKVLSSIF